MHRLIIIDDEQNARELIASVIKKKCNQVQIVAIADCMKSGIHAIEEHKPDIVLLDINMHDGSGFDLLNKLKFIDFKVIFITAYEKYAVKAFKFNALDYILKPFDEEELVIAIEKAGQNLQQRNIFLSTDLLKENFNSKNKNTKKIILKTIDSVYSVAVKEITRLESDGNYTYFFLTDGRKIMVSTILKEYDELLNEYGFFRTHQSHLINMDYFERYKKLDGGYIIMKDGTNVPVASRKKDMLLYFIEKYN